MAVPSAAPASCGGAAWVVVEMGDGAVGAVMLGLSSPQLAARRMTAAAAAAILLDISVSSSVLVELVPGPVFVVRVLGDLPSTLRFRTAVRLQPSVLGWVRTMFCWVLTLVRLAACRSRGRCLVSL